MSIAVLGLQVNSTQVVAATTALNNMTAAAKPATAAATALTQATNNAGKGVQQLTAATSSAGKGVQHLTTNTGLARHEMINLSRQIQDVGVSLASGQSPLMVLAQQGTQVFDIFASSKTGTVAGTLRQIVSGIGLVRIGMVGFAGAAIGAAFSIKSVTDSTKEFDTLARSINANRGELNLLQQAASFKGISSDDFAKGMQRFGASVYDARNNMGGLAEVMRANGKTAKDFNGYLEAAADLIKNATDDQARLQLLQQMGLPATMEWVKLLSQGKEGIRAATAEAVRFNESAEGKMIAAAEKFDEAWNKATTNFVNYFKSGIISVVGVLSSVQVPQWLLNMGRGAAGNLLSGPAGMVAGAIAGGLNGNSSTFGDRFGAFDSVGNAGALGRGLSNRANQLNGTGNTVDPNAAQRAISLQQQQLALYGQTLTAAEAVKQVELQVQQARLSGVSIDQKRVEVLKQQAAEQAIGVAAIKASTDAANIEAATVGMSAGAAAQYTAAQNALNDAKRRGMDLTPENIAQIQREAATLGEAAAKADLMRFSFQSLVNGPIQAFTSAISQGASAWDAFKKAGASALNAIASKLAEMAAQNLWQSAFGGGGGNIFSSLFGLGGSGSTPVMSGTGLGAGTGGLSFPMYAGGTDSAPGGWSWVGERGPELMNVPKGAQILPTGVTPSSGGVTVNQGSTNIVVQGSADEKAIAYMNQQLAIRDQRLVYDVANAVREAGQRRLGR